MKPFFHPAFHGWFGVARRDITPDLGIYARNWGAASDDVAQHVHRALTLTTLTIQTGPEAEPLALIALDLGWWRSPKEAEQLVNAVERAGIKRDRALIALAHTHSGPVFCPAETDRTGGEKIPGYLNFLEEAIASSLREALAGAEAGVWETATGRCGLATHRDLPDPAGPEEWLVGWNPALEADDTLLVGRVTTAQGHSLATLVNYACHPTILGWENETLSPDYIGAMREVVEKQTGVPMLFLQGASGELAARHQYVADPTVADRAGYSLGYAVLSTLSGMLEPRQELFYAGRQDSGAPLALWKSRERALCPDTLRVTTLRTDLPLRDDLPTLDQLRDRLSVCSDRTEAERLQRQLLRRGFIGSGKTLERVYAIWQLGEIVLVSVPDEAYSLLQTRLREVIAPRPLFVATLANGSYGYLAPEAVFDHGGYAARMSPYAPGALEFTLTRLEAALSNLP